eukprot:m.2582 g.2582  ORF g.2582 m.2582 type:complete len:87 (-) comp3659_c0_seq1:31-291(-)
MQGEATQGDIFSMLRPLLWIDVDIAPVNATLLPNTTTFVRDKHGRIRGQLSADYACRRKLNTPRRARASTTGSQEPVQQGTTTNRV